MAKGQARAKRTSKQTAAKAKVVKAQSPAPVEATPNASPDPLSKLAALFGGGGARKPSTTLTPVSSERDYALPPLHEVPPVLVESWQCRCWQRYMAPKKMLPGDTPTGGSECMNPYIYGHEAHCRFWQLTCESCGHANGTHQWNCVFWREHPEQSPF